MFKEKQQVIDKLKNIRQEIADIMYDLEGFEGRWSDAQELRDIHYGLGEFIKMAVIRKNVREEIEAKAT